MTVTRTDTQQQRSLVTDKSGAYSAELLTAGTYSVAAEAQALPGRELSGVQVGVNQVVRLDIELKVGSASQTVEVTAAPPILSTETSSLSTIETGQRIVNLPLNGRNFTQLAWLGPGATPGSSAGIGLTTSTDDPRQGVQLAVNGLFGFDNNFLLDGVDNNEFGEGTIAVQPSPDALQTFSIEESSMKAEFGRGGAAVNAVLKSGTNSFHGGGFEYFRNSALDAANYFATTGKPPFKRNQFGGFIGGPIIKDRTFFFGDYQGTRYNEGVTYVSTVPTQAERNGDFSALGVNLYDPYTTTSTGSRSLIDPADPGVIPSNRIDPVGQAVVNLLPLPTVSGAQTNNYVISPSQTYSDDQFDVRVDHTLRPSDHLFAHAGYERIVFSKPPPLGVGRRLLQWHWKPYQDSLPELRGRRNAHLQQQLTERRTLRLYPLRRGYSWLQLGQEHLARGRHPQRQSRRRHHLRALPLQPLGIRICQHHGRPNLCSGTGRR